MAENRSLFTDGHLNDLCKAGWRPDMREPPNKGLPDTNGRVMKVETSWFAGRPRPEQAGSDGTLADATGAEPARG